MQRGNLDDLSAFLIVAREGSFTKAAAKLGVSQSALSYTIKELEARLKLRLLTRTTRSVSPTAAGERLLRNVGPRLEEIEAELAALSELREKPSGTIRITATEYATSAVLLPKLVKFLRDLSGHQGRDHQRLRPDRYRRPALRCRRSGWRASGERHDRRAHRPRCRMAVVGTPSYFREIGESRRSRRSWSSTTASICGCRPMAGCTRGSSKRDRANSRCGSKANCSSTPRPKCSMGHLLVWDWPICQKAWCSRTSTRAVSNGCSKTGALPIPAIISIIRAGASRPRPLRCSSRRCDTGT